MERVCQGQNIPPQIMARRDDATGDFFPGRLLFWQQREDLASSILLLLPPFIPFHSFPSLPLYISAYSYPIMHHFGLLGVMMDKEAERERTGSQRPGRSRAGESLESKSYIYIQPQGNGKSWI